MLALDVALVGRLPPPLAVYGVGLASHAAAWVAVVWVPASAWSTSAVGLTALPWTTITPRPAR